MRAQALTNSDNTAHKLRIRAGLHAANVVIAALKGIVHPVCTDVASTLAERNIVDTNELKQLIIVIIYSSDFLGGCGA